ncbi:MAG: hypothetical protein M1819_000161 [Sarea resinae]|nr:MAG: hypothetical protein M1819_000161 [Sarea resinae]
MSSPDPPLPTCLDIAYSVESLVQNVAVCIPHPLEDGDYQSRIWIIYIHGGAWRDPEILADSFNPTLLQLMHHPIKSRVAGFASINYRLSPFPSHPRNPSMPENPARNARHPDHIEDVLTAVCALQQRYGFGERYLLVGHSCGATLAFQAAMNKWEGDNGAEVILPCGIVGVEGIYDLPTFRDTHRDMPVYEEIIQNAFGKDERLWHEVSPVSCNYATSWPNAQLTLLAQSKDDELVDEVQRTRMTAALEAASSNPSTGAKRKDILLTLRGKHDEIWEEGTELVRVILEAMDHIV